MAWERVRVLQPTKKSQWNNLISALNAGHGADGTHKRSVFLEREYLRRPHVMDTSPATTVSLIAAGGDLAFACGATADQYVQWDYIPAHGHISAAGITFRVFFAPLAAEGTTIVVGADMFRFRQGAGLTQIALPGASMLISAATGQSVSFYTATGYQSGDALALQFYRDADHAGDTYSGDVYVLSAQLEYTYQ